MVAFVNSIAVNGTLSRGDLFALLRRFSNQGLIVSGSDVVVPTGNVVPTPGYTLRTTLSNVTVV
jgi:hypothetical protein